MWLVLDFPLIAMSQPVLGLDLTPTDTHVHERSVSTHAAKHTHTGISLLLRAIHSEQAEVCVQYAKEPLSMQCAMARACAVKSG